MFCKEFASVHISVTVISEAENEGKPNECAAGARTHKLLQ